MGIGSESLSFHMKSGAPAVSFRTAGQGLLMNSADTARMFAGYYNTQHECSKSERRAERWIVPNLIDLGIKQGSVLSAGCGNGADVAALRAHGYHAVGVDLYPPKANATFAIASVLALPFADSTFDAVVFLEVIEHLPEKERSEACRSLLRVLKPGGWIIIATPNRLFPLDEHGFLVRVHSPLRDYTVTVRELEREFGLARTLSWTGYFAFERFGLVAKILSHVVSVFDERILHRSWLNPHLFLAFQKDVQRMS